MSDSQRAAWLDWARRSLIALPDSAAELDDASLDPLGAMVGDATLVILSEALHGAAEPLLFRNAVFEYLVRAKGFTSIAIESGTVEGRVVHEYVRGGAGDLSEVMAAGFSWTFDRLPQNRELVRWLREYNTSRPAAAAINFYGFDVPGSPVDIDNEVRDLTQAENIERIVAGEGTRAKLLIFSHRYHASATHLTAAWGGSRLLTTMGSRLRRRFGSRLLVIGNLIGTGTIDGAGDDRFVEAPYDELGAELQVPCFLLDLRDAPDPVARWLEGEHVIGRGQQELKLPLGRAFDVLFYRDTVTPAGGDSVTNA